MEHIGSVMGYHFRNEHLVEDALDLSGLRPNQANRRLALIGDMVLRSAILDDWYPTTRAYRYGIPVAFNLTSALAGNDNLARVGREAGLDSIIVVNPAQQGQRVSNKTLATTVEAVFGALYIDSGKDLTAVKKAMTAFNLDPNTTA